MSGNDPTPAPDRVTLTGSRVMGEKQLEEIEVQAEGSCSGDDRETMLALVAEVRRLTLALPAARREGGTEMLTRCRGVAREVFDSHPVREDPSYEPPCNHDVRGWGACSECDPGFAIIAALECLPVDPPPGDAP